MIGTVNISVTYSDIIDVVNTVAENGEFKKILEEYKRNPMLIEIYLDQVVTEAIKQISEKRNVSAPTVSSHIGRDIGVKRTDFIKFLAEAFLGSKEKLYCILQNNLKESIDTWSIIRPELDKKFSLL